MQGKHLMSHSACICSLQFRIGSGKEGTMVFSVGQESQVFRAKTGQLTVVRPQPSPGNVTWVFSSDAQPLEKAQLSSSKGPLCEFRGTGFILQSGGARCNYSVPTYVSQHIIDGHGCIGNCTLHLAACFLQLAWAEEQGKV